MSLNNCVSTLSNVASEWQFVCVLILGPAEPKCLVWLVLMNEMNGGPLNHASNFCPNKSASISF